jgi:plasmid maintenance system antidote protein VapI
MVNETDKRSLSEKLTSMGVSKSHASEILSGRKRPSLELAVNIERQLGIPPSHWIDAQKCAEKPAA